MRSGLSAPGEIVSLMETMTRAIVVAWKLIGAALLAAAALGALAAVPAHAAPPCAQFDTCQYMPNPSYDGPLMPARDAPGTYGGWTNLPVMCDPATYRYIPSP